MSTKLPSKPDRKRFDAADIKAVTDVLEQDELWPYFDRVEGKLPHWKAFRNKLESLYLSDTTPAISAVPTSSGTASIHVALGGLQIPAGSEVIVPPITDMGTIMPIIFQNCIPVFADVDEETGLLTDKTIASKITDLTSAVIVVHLSGSPADMDPINKLCAEKGIAVIEDCAQALGASYKKQQVGTLASAGAFSLNSWKHITSGEGGFLLVTDDVNSEQFIRSQLFADKSRDRLRATQDEFKSYNATGLNYRMSDLELALAITQIDNIEPVSTKFTQLGRYLDQALENVPGILTQKHHPEAIPVYFFSWFRLTPEYASKRNKLVSALKPIAGKMGMTVTYSYGDPIYTHPVFKNKSFFPNAQGFWPAELMAKAQHGDLPSERFSYEKVKCPNAEMWSESGIGLMFNESHGTEHIDAFVEALSAQMQALD